MEITEIDAPYARRNGATISPGPRSERYGGRHRVRRIKDSAAGIVPPKRVRIYLRDGHYVLQGRDQAAKQNLSDRVSDELLSTTEAARRLGISRASLYDWLSRSNAGEFMLCSRPVTIAHLQSGAKGQGRIRIEASEIERLKDLMRVHPRRALARRPPSQPNNFPGITVKLGRPRN
jgi:hypothetical protein